ncbi:MAG: response regulator [Deltaproteobacteria bacterium]|nr:response regulator [Deltaproteobacteria bacterium]
MSDKILTNNGYTPKILIVDDEKRIREGCHAILTREGYEVAFAEDGKKGLEMIDREHFDIILLDLMMPEISGLSVLPKVKTLHPDTVIIVITGYATVEHSIEAMKSGAFDFIPKPFSPEQLKVVVSKGIEHTRALQDIAKEKSRMRGLINRLADGVMATDHMERAVLANPAFLRFMKYHGASVIGQPIETFVKDINILQLIKQALSVPQDEYTELTEEIRLVNDDENGYPDETILSIHCIPFKDRSGLTIGTINVLHDITALKKIDQMKSEFVSTVSHEIRSPLSSILMQLKVVLDGLAGEVSEKQQEILFRATDRINSLIKMASELLDLAKIESGLITLQKESIQFNELLEDQVAFHKETAAAKNITIHFTQAEDLPRVMANRGNMEEVASNLITNAIKYTPEGGKIELVLDRKDDFVCITVRDSGFGIPEEDLKKIFNRFYRIINEKTRYTTGTGLGLPIVKSIVEAHQGTVEVESIENFGSAFRVYLPFIPV